MTDTLPEPKPIRILLLEDSPLDAGLVLAYLERGNLSFTHKQADTRASFVEALQPNKYDLVLADYHLPDFTGHEALKMVRQSDLDLPFIFVSGMMGEEIAIESLQQGATDYVLKRRLERLVPAVKRSLAERQERRERRRFEDALCLSEERFRCAFEQAAIGMCLVNSEHRLESVNAAFCGLLGSSSSELRGCSLFLFLHPEDRVEALDQYHRMLAGEFNSFVAEARYVLADEAIFWVRHSFAAVRGGNSQQSSTIVLCEDITQRKRAEDCLLQQTQELARSNNDLQQFAYVTSHDLQEPLRTIISFTQLLQRSCQGRLSAEADELIDHITAATHRMIHLIQDVLAYSKTLDGERAQPVLLEMNSVVESACMNLRQLVEDTGCAITVEPLPQVRGVSAQLIQVFQNLIGNAIKYRGAEKPCVRIYAELSNQHWVFCVQDNGAGIAPHFYDRIFGIFKRLHGREVPGNGIGLALCKKIVEMHHGRIWVKSTVGVGSQFYFSLPAAVSSERAG